jgi:hypothetical protein
VLYRRAGCHLCDEARTTVDAILADLAAGGPNAVAARVEERDVDADETLRQRFTTTVPVVEVGDRRLELATSPLKIRRFLVEALAAST